jgi:hypothetical protein
MTTTVESPKQVRCPECCGWRFISARNARAIAAGQSSGLCIECRNRRTGGRVARTSGRESLQRWWLRHYSDEELADLARGLGAKGASAERVAASRARLRPRAGPRREEGVR